MAVFDGIFFAVACSVLRKKMPPQRFFLWRGTQQNAASVRKAPARAYADALSRDDGGETLLYYTIPYHTHTTVLLLRNVLRKETSTTALFLSGRDAAERSKGRLRSKREHLPDLTTTAHITRSQPAARRSDTPLFRTRSRRSGFVFYGYCKMLKGNLTMRWLMRRAEVVLPPSRVVR